MDTIYLDYNATTPIAPEVAEAMRPFLTAGWGNPSSDHSYGREARAAVQTARAQTAQLLGCAPDEVVFTGGGSEADNHALKGVVEARGVEDCEVVTSVVEHPAVLNTCRYLERRGVRVTYLPVGRQGRVDPASVTAAITPATALVSIMHANNETGTLQPIAEIAAIARERGVLLHTDAAQSVGKVSTRVDELGVDLLTVAGHKLYAPNGIGALYVRAGTRLEPLIHGAGHENGRRAGTENILEIVGLGAACTIAQRDLTALTLRLRSLSERLWDGLRDRVGGVRRNGHPTESLPNTLNVSFDGLYGDELLAATSEIAASTGSACHAGSRQPSPVLTAMGVPGPVALGAVRFSLGRDTTEEQIDAALGLLAERAARLRGGTS
jgi:cysteine desulfurase